MIKNNVEEVIGWKGDKAAALYTAIGLVLVLMFFVFADLITGLTYPKRDDPFLNIVRIAYLVGSIPFLGRGIYLFTVPRELIKITNDTIILARPAKEIKLVDISYVLSKRAKMYIGGRNGTRGTHGTIIIRTINGEEFKQRHVSKVWQVEDEIKQRLKEFNGHETPS